MVILIIFTQLILRKSMYALTKTSWPTGVRGERLELTYPGFPQDMNPIPWITTRTRIFLIRGYIRIIILILTRLIIFILAPLSAISSYLLIHWISNYQVIVLHVTTIEYTYPHINIERGVRLALFRTRKATYMKSHT